jgi:transcription termination factor Rho
MVKLWIVTGGIGTGKSTVSRRLAALAGENGAIYSADEAVTAAYRDPDVIEQLQAAFGLQIGEDGITADQRKQLRDLITSSPPAKSRLEGILHPWVFRAMDKARREAKSAGKKVLVAEVPLYYETGRDVAANCVVVVAASRASQIARLQKSRGLDEATSVEMINLQIPVSAKVDRSDVVIWNDGSLQALEQQIDLLKPLLLETEDTLFMNEATETPPAPSESSPVPTATTNTVLPEGADATQTANAAKAEETRSIPEELSIDEMQSMSPAALQQLADQVGWRINASRNKHQLIFDIISWTGTRGTRFKVDGVLDIDPQGFGMLRYPRYSFKPLPEDVFVPAFLIRKFGFVTGQRLSGLAKIPKEREKYAVLDRVNSVEGIPFEDWQIPTPFDKLTALFPSERIILEARKDATASSRVVDIVAPLGKGQRGLIVASPRSGKTMLLKDIARSITSNHPEVSLIVLLLDERPEEVTDFEETVSGCEIFSSTFDESPKRHTQVAELVIERAKRLVELKKDVVILLDSITRLSRGYNAMAGGKGRTMSGGMDAKAMSKPKKFFGAARNVEEGGSLTVIATALVETESRMDDLIFEEFKGTGNMEIHLDREMAERRIYPAIHVTKSGTRRDDLLYHPDEFRRISMIRRQLASVPAIEALETLVRNMHKVKTNAEILMLGLR